MKFLESAYAEIVLPPDDMHDEYGVPMGEWVAEGLSQRRIELAKAACDMMRRAVPNYESELRHQPHVCENYIPIPGDPTGDIIRYFIFKLDNNGDTYIIEDMSDCTRTVLRSKDSVDSLVKAFDDFML